MNDPIVIVNAVRTPTGRLLGQLSPFTASELGAYALSAAISRATIAADRIDQVFMGCVLQAGQGQAPARQAAIAAKIAVHTPCVTINKMCGSGMQAVIFAHDTIAAGSATIIAAGGMESMTHAPYLLLKARQGYRLGKNDLYDHLTLDGLEDAYTGHHLMGYFADQCAKQFGFSREEQDQYAMHSFERAITAAEKGLLEKEIVPLKITTQSGNTLISRDEGPYTVDPKKIPILQPIFTKQGTVTAGNASSIADGAAALILMRLSQAVKLGIKPLAKIMGHATAAQAPSDFPTAPIFATQQLLNKLQWPIEQVELFEINEAFSVVVLAMMQKLAIPIEKINIFGGSCALGHPIGASGARILVTLLNAMHYQGAKRGIATLCIGGGEATAMALEAWQA